MTAQDSKPTPRPSRDRAAWLMHPVSAAGRLKIDAFQYEELRAEAIALKGERDALQVDAGHRKDLNARTTGDVIDGVLPEAFVKKDA